MTRAERVARLKAELNKRILVLDGAMGTAIQQVNPTVADFGGAEYEGCNEYLVVTAPHIIGQIHEDYLAAGCDILETDTFGGTPLVLAEFGLGDKAHEINLAAARLARAAADKFSTQERPRFVAGSIGPTTKAITVTGGVTFEQLVDTFQVQVKALYEGGVDYFLVETCQDTRNIKAALLAIDRFHESVEVPLPVAVSGTIEPMGTMLAGQPVDALVAALMHKDLLYLGLNCATGPEFMTDHIRSLAKLAPFPVGCVPNAGLPDENGTYLETPAMIASVIQRFVDQGWINVLGGCCGTTPPHIKAMAELAAKAKPRTPNVERRSVLSGIEYLEITDENRPVIVGERTNVIGSRKFKQLIEQGKFDEATEIARAQVKNGAQVIDICLANPDRDELADMRQFLDLVIKKIKAPIMIDSTDDKVIEASLTYCQGKAIINSINLEDGEERFEKVVPLALKYGAALVVGTIDDDKQQGMGVTRQRKLEIARRAHKLLIEKYGVRNEDIYWDPLVFPCATGDAQYVGSAVETIEGVRLLKEAFPGTRTVLGISNVSFGLPPAGREVLNSVFLYHCVKAGLDLAIVNAEKLERYATIPDDEKELADNLLFTRGDDPVGKFAARFRDRDMTRKADSKAGMTLDQRLASYIVEGSKDGLIADLEEKLKELSPLEIINGPLMAGMDEVGRLFNDNKLIVAEVLQSAEAMKAAVAHLEPKMAKSDSASRGSILLATVKGDVHDIGKNLVEIILSNNGFKVINLGIKVPPEVLIQEARDKKPDMIGLSGLLVKSAQQMVITAEDLARAGVNLPILVGGAALTPRFVRTRIAPAYGVSNVVAYARDAMEGLDLAKRVMTPGERDKMIAEYAKAAAMAAESAKAVVASEPVPARPPVNILDSVPAAPDLERHVLRNIPIDSIWQFINPLMLYGNHLGVKGGVIRQLESLRTSRDAMTNLSKEFAAELRTWETVEDLKNEYRNEEAMVASAVYQFFRASRAGDSVLVHDVAGRELTRFTFPRAVGVNGRCLADFVHPDPAKQDTIVLFATSVGRGVRAEAERLKEAGEYVKSHALQALVIESAEGLAEMLHSRIRTMWGFPDSPEMTMMQRFQSKYRGRRYSFGYPACPNLEDQAILWKLLRPQDIGVELTDGFMMEPESSVSAMVVHHPQATYFSVRQGEADPEAG